MKRKRPKQRISFLLATFIAILVGVWLGVHGYYTSTSILVGCVVLAGLLWLSQFWWVGLITLGLFLGLTRGHIYASDVRVITSRIGSVVAVSATVSTDPVTNARHQTEVRVNHITIDGLPAPGTIRLTGFGLRLERGYSVMLTGRLKDGFATWSGEMSYPKLHIVNDKLSPLESLRKRFFIGMHTALPDPEASFGLGLLVGVGALIPKDLQLQLTRVGLSHLTAVSGYNLTIIVRLITRLFGKLGPNVAMLLSLWLIGCFIVLAGASASIVRAGAVSTLSLIAGRSGLNISPSVLIGVVAAATLLYDPGYLKDAGWALSFLAFFGILVLAPATMERWGEPKLLIGRMVLETLCAELMTLPYVLCVFGQISYVGLLANTVVEPFVPIGMACAAVAGMVAIVVPALSPLTGWVGEHYLGFMLKIITSFADLPWAASALTLSLAGAIACYSFVLLIMAIIMRRSAKRAQFAILSPDRSTQCLDTRNGPP